MIALERACQTIPPWEGEPYRLVSLGNIMQFAEDEVVLGAFGNFYYGLGALDLAAMTPGASVGQRDEIMFTVFFEEAIKDMKRLGLRVAASHTEDVVKILEGNNPHTHPRAKLHDHVTILRSALAIELAQTVFLHVSSAEANYYREPLDGITDDVHDRFSSTLEDLRESAKCYALGRPAASVFHAMRAAEVGLMALGKDLMVPAATNKNWHDLLVQIEQAIKRIDEKSHGSNWRDDRQWYSDAATQLRYFKDAWRNEVMHAHQSYSESRAREILTATRAFMCQIATRLPE